MNPESENKQHVQVLSNIILWSLQIEMFESKLTIYMEKIVNLTVLSGIMENDPDSYTEVHMQEVKIEIKQIEALIVELWASIEISSTVLVRIRKEVKRAGCVVLSWLRVCWYGITHEVLL